MKNLVCAFLIIFSIHVQGAENNSVTELSLEEAIRQTVKNNLDIQIELINPDIAQQTLKKNTAIFIPTLDINFSKTENNSPSRSVLDGGTLTTSENVNASISLSQKLALGGTMQISLDNSRYSSTSTFSTMNPSLNSTLTFSLSQPLLKNFGTHITKRNILIAANSQRLSQAAFKQKIIDLIYSVEEAYWNLVYSKRNLEVKNKSLQLAQDMLRQSEVQVRVGVSAPMDILTSKAEVAARESELLQVEGQIKIAEENLKRILNITDSPQKIEPSDQPAFTAQQTNFDQFLLTALENRPDIEQVRLDLKSKRIDVKYYRNQLLPDLQLTASYYTSGLSGDRLIFDGNPFTGGTVIGVIKGDIWDSLKDTVSNLYRNYSLALKLSIPLKNDLAKSDWVQAQMNLKKSLLQLKQVENTIYSEVKQAIIMVEQNQKIVQASMISRQLAEEKLTAEQKKLSVGLSTHYQVLQFQRDFSTTQTTELKALIDYNLSLSNLQKILGTTLEDYGITFTASSSD